MGLTGAGRRGHPGAGKRTGSMAGDKRMEEERKAWKS